MKKSTETVREQAVPKTIKVKTLVIGIVVTLSLFASFVGGWTVRSYDNARVQAEATNLVSTLKIEK